jgi:hypothetical protein
MDKESRKGIVIGLVSSTFFLVIVQPSLGLCWKWLTSTGSAVSERLSNRLYQAAALGPRNWVVVDLATFGFALFLGFYISVFVMLYLTFRRLKNEIGGSHEDSIESIQHKISGHEKRLRKYFITYSILIVGIAMTGGFTVFRYSADLRLNTSFSHRLTILTPKITQKEVDEFRAEWAQMKSRKDYEAIVDHMDAVAKSSLVELPPPAMK